MLQRFNLKKLKFLVFGLGSTGKSIIQYLKRNNVRNYFLWDDNKEIRKKFKVIKNKNLAEIFAKVDYILLSPGISINNSQHKKNLTKFRNKVITDIDLLYLSGTRFKSIVVTGSNGKSTTCKMINHLLKKNRYKSNLGGNIGNPILNFKAKKNVYFVIEASSFQLSHSKFIKPDYAILLNITNDHLDWHKTFGSYKRAKMKVFKLQNENDFAIIDEKLKSLITKNKYLSKIFYVNTKLYDKIKHKIKNLYLRSKMNEENMGFVYSLSKLLKISEKKFIKSMNTFSGLPHRYEVFLKKKGITFINDSKATSFNSSKNALASNRNIYWIFGGLPKDKDVINLDELKNNIIKAYIIGKNINFFKNQIKNSINFSIEKNLKQAVISALKDIKLSKQKKCTILFSPSAASYDQFKNFEHRGNNFKRLSNLYAKRI